MDPANRVLMKLLRLVVSCVFCVHVPVCAQERAVLQWSDGATAGAANRQIRTWTAGTVPQDTRRPLPSWTDGTTPKKKKSTVSSYAQRLFSRVARRPTKAIGSGVAMAIPTTAGAKSNLATRAAVPRGGIAQAGHQVVASSTSCDDDGGQCSGCDDCASPGAPPLGASLDHYFGRQIYNGNRARQVLYHYDFGSWNGDPSRLNIYGLRKLRRMVPLMEATGAPIIVQSVPERPALAEARRSHVLEVLQSRLGVPVDENQIVVGVPPVPGLEGFEAMEIYANQVETLRSQGADEGGFQSGFTSSVLSDSNN